MHRGERRASYARGEAEYWGLLLKEISVMRSFAGFSRGLAVGGWKQTHAPAGVSALCFHAR
jgi:hypothetical protein